MPRRTTLLATAGAVACLVMACTATAPPDGGPTGPTPPTRSASPAPKPTPEVRTAELRLPEDPATVLAADDASAAAVATSATLFASVPVAVLAPADDVAAQVTAASHAVTLGAPLLLAAEGAGDAVADELARLGVDAVLTVGAVSLGDADGNGGTGSTGSADSTGSTDDAAAVPAGVVPVAAPDDVAGLEELLRTDLDETVIPEGDALAAVLALDRDAPTVLRLGGPPADEATDATPGDEQTDGTPSVDEDDAPDEPQDAGGTHRPRLDVEIPDVGGGADDDEQLPLTELAPAPEGGLLLVTGSPADVAPVATARAAGWEVAVVPDGDPRTTSATVQAVAAAAPERTVAVGSAFGTADALAWKVATAATGTELPGGGQVLFPGRRMIALYGTPGTASLGLLGEQGLEESIERAKMYVRHYRDLTEDTVVPAFEIIVTVASAGAGDDDQYSRRLPAESFVPWVEAARDAGVYVVLDLQPGRTDFLTQAKQYESLLRYPNVGLALDPEWRLEPDQVHLRQIGSVDIDEVNTVVHWLADLTREHALPQKLLVLHQFSLRMISDRERLDTSREELALMIHVDGQGTQPAKQGTWRTLRADAPDVWWGWKNFVDEDEPMLTPEQTYGQVEPVPHLVTYQ